MIAEPLAPFNRFAGNTERMARLLVRKIPGKLQIFQLLFQQMLKVSLFVRDSGVLGVEEAIHPGGETLLR